MNVFSKKKKINNSQLKLIKFSHESRPLPCIEALGGKCCQYFHFNILSYKKASWFIYEF